MTIDTREKDNHRINIVTKYFLERGACVIRNKLDTLDYHVEGYYDNKYVNLGIEYKTGSDFAGNRDELNNRFARACLEYEQVGFILEHDHIKIRDQLLVNNEVTVFDYMVDYNKQLILSTNYHGLKNTLRTYEREGILTAEINKLFEFPRMIIGFLNYITSDDHKGMCFENNSHLNVIMKIPGIGVDKGNKLLKKFDSINNIAIADMEELKECIGKKSGEKLYEYLRSGYNDMS